MGFYKKLTSPIVWGNLLAILIVTIVLFILVWRGMDSYTHHGERIEVPNLVGKQETDACYRLNQLGLHGVVVDSAYNKSMPAGCILDQTPTSGRKVKSGREIFLIVNTTRIPTVVLPDIADNSSLREAQARLTAMGFRLGSIEYVPGGDKDWVYGIKSRGQNVYAGDRVPIDVPLVLQVGGGSSDIDLYDDMDDESLGEEPLGLDDVSE